jgi:hypothetical protein
MITPILEKLILSGRAFYKTAVVGGSKTTLDIENDRFIIITDIYFLGYGSSTIGIGTDNNTQLSVYGEKGFNHYIFANARTGSSEYWDSTAGASRRVTVRNAISPAKIDTYILHTTSVGFSFIVSGSAVPTSTLSIASGNNPGLQPPIDYGIDGQPGALNVDTIVTPIAGLDNDVVPRFTGIAVGTPISNQIQYPATAALKPVIAAPAFPIANITYVEVLGQPDNIGF